VGSWTQSYISSFIEIGSGVWAAEAVGENLLFSGMENITIFSKISKISDIFDIFDIYRIFSIVMFKNKNLY